ncbi:MAG: ATP-binding protein [Pseudomonadota bacterium]
MRISDFIENNLESILQEWEHFAGMQRPAAEGMTSLELRDLAEVILRAIADDLRREESEQERHVKATAEAGAHEPGREMIDSAKDHAAERLASGFTLNQVVAEYRALRASVTRLWRVEVTQAGESELEELVRFNEAIDESLTEAISWYNARVEGARDLLNGVLAHDLRAPLNAVLAVADVLRRDESLDSHYTEMAARVRNSATRMNGMINDLLDFTRTRLGAGLPVYPEDVDLREIVEQEIGQLRSYNPAAEIVFEASGDLEGCWDPARLKQALSNLIVNAVQHGRAGSAITVTARGEGDQVIIRVHNEGGGIPPELRSAIFDPFSRGALDANRPNDEGVGLGLYIARQIVEAHHGTIEVTSSEDQGTTFTARLPRRTARFGA